MRREFGTGPTTVALAEASFEVWPGELVAVVGPSGAGKSTLLNLMGLLDRPTRGSIEILGRDVTTLSERERDVFRGLHIGFVFQSSHLIGYESTANNVGLNLRVRGVDQGYRDDRITELLQTYGLSDRAATPGALLSGGERQRAAIARAAAGHPELLLADEPTGNLDSRNAAGVMRQLKGLARAGVAVVVITHDPTVAAAADRRLDVFDGRVSAPPRPKETTPAQARPGSVTRKHLGVDTGGLGSRKPTLPKGRALSRWADTLADGVNALWSLTFRSALLITAFALGVGGLIAASGLTATTSAHISDRLDDAALSEVRFQDLRDRPTLPVPAGQRDPRDATRGPVPSDAIVRAVSEQAASIDGVLSVGYEATADTVSIKRLHEPGPGAKTVISTLTAVNGERVKQFLVTGGVALWDSPQGGHQAILGAEAAQKLSVARAGPGVNVYVGDTRAAVVAVLPGRGDPIIDQGVFGNLNLARTVGDVKHAYVVKTRPGYPTAVGEAVAQTLSPGAPAAVHVQRTADLRNLKKGVAGDLTLMVRIMGIVLLILAALTAATSMYISVLSRTGEISLRRALGQSRLSIARQFILEGSLLGFVGGLGGLFLGVLFVVGLSMTQGWIPILDPVVMPLVAVLLGLGVGSIAAVVPAGIAARLEPAAGLRG
ncbi:ATP-binding cassette domain-containing protein [Falsarthrobacter nasiphocae]|uniref:ABC transporter ATP-binding protein/permease n=1 Tax=Falsarthrobacter nasiphocae TaxID=189863 RepID=UPI0031DBA4BC